MYSIIIPAIAGLLIGISFSGLTKKRKIIRLKSEISMLRERNELCLMDRTALLAKNEYRREISRSLRAKLILWEQLANEIVKHPHPDGKPFMKNVPESGIQLLIHYQKTILMQEKKISAAALLLKMYNSPTDFSDPEIKSMVPKVEKWLEIYNQNAKS